MWLWEWIDRAGTARLIDEDRAVTVRDLARCSCLPGGPEPLRGRSVLVATGDQLRTALALMELDGVAARLVLCPPDLPPAHLSSVLSAADVDACVLGATQPSFDVAAIARRVHIDCSASVPSQPRRATEDTEWVLLTSGTSGPPKLVLHTLAGLLSAFVAKDTVTAAPEGRVWSTFYDIRRYGGLQILLRALAGYDLVLTHHDRPVGSTLQRAAAAGVTHMTGTASHWRAVLMSGAGSLMTPRYVRLSGEIADQSILDALRTAYPQALIAHAFASTEAGVAFEVQDGQVGFPAAWVGLAAGAAPGLLGELRIRDERLAIRSAGTALRYIGPGPEALRDAEGFVDSGDRVERRDGRYHFLGRSGGIINVGGLKVHPEEVEAVINAHPWVHLSRVRARRSPITGAIVTAEVVLHQIDTPRAADEPLVAVLLDHCRAHLPAHKVPVSIRIVPSLAMSAAGKLVRSEA